MSSVDTKLDRLDENLKKMTKNQISQIMTFILCETIEPEKLEENIDRILKELKIIKKLY